MKSRKTLMFLNQRHNESGTKSIKILAWNLKKRITETKIHKIWDLRIKVIKTKLSEIQVAF